MKKYLPVGKMLIFLVLIGLTMSAYGVCLKPLSTLKVNIDTLQPGLVELTKCYSFVSGDADSCLMKDTVSENDLLELLVSEYNTHSFAIIGHIDSAVAISSFPPLEDISQESLMVVIDSTLKGDIPFKNKWVQNVYGCAYPSGRTIMGKVFLSFFDKCSTFYDLQVRGPSAYNEWQGMQGYFINEQRISKADDSCSMVGVSVGLSTMLQTVSIKIKKKSLNNNDPFIFIPNPLDSKVQISLPIKYLPAEVQIINIAGELFFHQRSINSKGISISMKGFCSGIYYLKLKSPRIHSTKRINLIK